MIIDTHLHVWSGDFEKYPFAPDRKEADPAPVELLLAVMGAAAVDRAVLVQPIHYLYDNRYAADCLRRFPDRLAAVGLIDQKAPDAPDQLEQLVQEDGFGGLRIHLKSRVSDPSEWATSDQDALWKRSEALGTCFIVHGPAQHLPAMEPIIARFPGVSVVLDHIGGAPTDEPPPRPLLGHVLGLAQYPNVLVKFIPQAGKSSEAYPYADTHDTFRRIYDAFGPERLMWGTNFPGGMRSTGYVRSLELFRTHLDFLGEGDLEWLFSRTALKVWRFDGSD